MTTNVKLGVAFDLNGIAIALEPKEFINEIKEKGIELALPNNVQSVYLGTAGQGINSILETFDSEYRVSDEEGKTNIKGELPDFNALTSTYDKVINAQLYVEKFKVKIPGSETKALDPNAKAEYTIGMAAKWTPDKNSKDSTGLTLTGIYLEISNEETGTGGTSGTGTGGTSGTGTGGT